MYQIMTVTVHSWS